MRLNFAPLRPFVFPAIMLAGAVIFCGVVFLALCAATLPAPHDPEAAAAAITYTSSNGAQFASRGSQHGDPITADHLPKNLVDAVVAIEDRRFFQHHGVDLHGILRAGLRDIFGHRIEGASTITQQLARVTYLSPERTLRRKVQEMMLAVWLDATLSKQEILARYLNGVYFGAGAYGADAAAKRYFGKPVAALDVGQAAMLAGLIRAPSQLAPSRNLPAAEHRAEQVLKAMEDNGTLTEAQVEAVKTQPVRLAIPPESDPNDNYFVDTADVEVKRVAPATQGDLVVTTTIDPRLQDAAQQIVEHWLATEGAKRHVTQAALVALAPDGAVLAMVGGRDYTQSQFNRATQARRQPGSLFKIFVYLTALSNGFRPDSVMVDQPVKIGDWQPKNYDGRFRGPITLRAAFAESINTIAAQLIQAVGPDKVVAMAKSLGIQADLPAVPSIALGAAGVSLIDMTRAMDAIAIDSKSVEPYTVRAIRNSHGVVYTRPETTTDRPDWDWADMMRLMEAVVTEGTGKAARLDRRSAGKTGTTDDYRDAWFVGFTSNIVVGVWTGNDDNSPMDQVTGGDLPARVWHDFVTAAERIMVRPLPRAPVARGDRPVGTPPGVAAGPMPGVAPAAMAAPVALPTLPPRQPVALGPDGTVAMPPGMAGEAPPSLAPAPAGQPAPTELRGVPMVIDTGTLLIDGHRVKLSGVAGEAGEPADELLQYLGGREVECAATGPGSEQYRCRLGRHDLGEEIVLNGAGRAAEDAPDRMHAAEDRARRSRRGIWDQ